MASERKDTFQPRTRAGVVADRSASSCWHEVATAAASGTRTGSGSRVGVGVGVGVGVAVGVAVGVGVGVGVAGGARLLRALSKTR